MVLGFMALPCLRVWCFGVLEFGGFSVMFRDEHRCLESAKALRLR